MNLLSWSCRGLGNVPTVNDFCNLCWRECLNIVFIKEIMINAKELEKVRNKCGFFKGLCISSQGLLSGLGLWWLDCNVRVVFFDNYYIAGEVINRNGFMEWYMAGCYGWSDKKSKYLIWKFPRLFRSVYSGSLVIYGDFNEILVQEEKRGG